MLNALVGNEFTNTNRRSSTTVVSTPASVIDHRITHPQTLVNPAAQTPNHCRKRITVHLLALLLACEARVPFFVTNC